jgi:NAD-dependent SIR2 family protein deacetylase
MSKKICRDEDLVVKIKGKKKKYICTKCDKKSPKEKWCCKAEEIKR